MAPASCPASVGDESPPTSISGASLLASAAEESLPPASKGTPESRLWWASVWLEGISSGPGAHAAAARAIDASNEAECRARVLIVASFAEPTQSARRVPDAGPGFQRKEPCKRGQGLNR